MGINPMKKKTVVFSQASELARALERFRSSGQFSWTYLGNQAAFFYSIQEGLNRFATYVCSGQYINATASRIWREFLNLDQVVEVDVADLRWATTSVAERSPLSSMLFYHLCAALSLPRILEDIDGELLIVVDDAYLAAFLSRVASRTGKCEVQLWGSFNQEEAGALFKTLRQHRRNQKSKFAAHASHFIGRLRSRKELVANLRQKAGRPLGALPKQIDHLLVSWIQPESFARHARAGRDDFFGPLPFWLEEAGGSVVFLVNPLDWVYPIEKIYEGVFRGTGPCLFIEDCVDLDAFESTAQRLLEFTLKLRGRWILEGVDVTPLLFEAFHHDQSIARPLFAQQFYHVGRFLAGQGSTVGNLIYPYENQPWEKGLRLGVREFLPATKLTAYQHCPVPPFWFSYFPSRSDFTANQIPDCLATHGEYWQRMFREYGFSESRTSVWPAFRFEALTQPAGAKAAALPQSSGPHLRVLLCLVIEAGPSLEMLTRTIEALHAIRNVRLEIRFHPRMGRESELLQTALRIAQLSSLPEEMIVGQRSASEALVDSEVVICNGSSVEFEAAHAGRTTIGLLSEFFVDQNVMPFAEYDFTCRTASELRAVVQKLAANRQSIQPRPWSEQKSREFFEPVCGATKHAVVTWLTGGGSDPQSLHKADAPSMDEARSDLFQTQESRMPRRPEADAESIPPPKVSVVIPCYNYAHFLPEAVESVARQTCRDFEIIIVDDGSTDNTASVARQLIDTYQDLPITLIRQSNSGQPASARNSGIDAARGEYVLPLDPDDKIAPTFLEKAVNLIESDGKVGVVYSQLQHFGDRQDIWRCGEFTLQNLLQDNCVPYCALYRKRLWAEVGGYKLNVKGYEDWDFWISLAEKGWEGRLIPEPLFFYRKHGSGLLDRANRNRELLKAQITVNHFRLYDWPRVQSASSRIVEARKTANRTSRPRVLLACPHFYPSVGGVESIVENLGRRLSFLDFDVEVAAYSNEARQTDDHLGMRVISLDREKISGTTLPRATVQLGELVCSGRYDACIAISDPSNLLFWAFHGLTLPRRFRLILQPVINDAAFHNWRGDREFRESLRSVLQSAHAVVSITRHGAGDRYFQEEKIDPAYIPNAVDVVAPAGDFRREHGIPKDMPLLLHVANLFRVKNHLGLFETLQNLPGEWRLAIIGGTTMEQNYGKAVREAVERDPKVIWIPGLPPEKVSAAMEAADLILLPSRAEASPVVILEAMSHAKAWVATPNCGAVHDNAGGVIVPLAEFPNAIATLLRETELRKALGQCGYDHWGACFSWNVVIRAWTSVIQGEPIKANFEMPAGVSARMAELRGEFQRQANQARATRSIALPSAVSGEAAVQPMKSPPRVSVVIPCYNYERYLPEAVDSVIKQTYQDFEIIIVNDGSTDDSAQVAESLRARYSTHRIKLINQPNSGQPAISRNRGIAEAQGEFILPLDADDRIAPTLLAECVQILESNPDVAIAYTDAIFFNRERSWIQPTAEYDFKVLIHANHLCYCSLFRRQAWETVGGYKTNVKGYEDWDFWIGCGEKGFVGKRIAKPLFHYREKADGLFQDALKRDTILRINIIANHPDLYPKDIVEIARRFLRGEGNPKAQSQGPAISVIVPTYNRPEMLAETLQSILSQTFQDFEILVVNDAGQDVSKQIEGLNASRKIRYFQHFQNRGLAAARNTGVNQARGKYITYLDDDDLFLPDHLQTLHEFLQKSGAKVAYTDAWRAHQMKKGGSYEIVRRDVPYSRDFDRDEILVGNFVPVLCFMHEKACWETAGGFDESLTSHEDWDLWIRMSRHFQFFHIPKVTCEFRWRFDGTSMNSGKRADMLRTATRVYEKSEHLVSGRPELQAARKAYLEGMKREVLASRQAAEAQAASQESASLPNSEPTASPLPGGEPATIAECGVRSAETVGLPPLPAKHEWGEDRGEWKSQHDSPPLLSPLLSSSGREGAIQSLPLVSIIVLTFDNLELNRECLASLYETIDPAKGEIIVVDNASTDGTADYLRREQQAGRLRAFLNSQNVGFARGCNQGALEARGHLLLFLNNDTRVTPGWCDSMIWAARLPRVGVVGVKLLYPDGRVQHAGFGLVGQMLDHVHRFAPASAPEVNVFRELDIVTGACLMIPRTLFFELNGFDESFKNGGEDVDLCLRVRAAGWKVVYEPRTVVYHHEAKSAGRLQHVPENVQLFGQRWSMQFDAKARFHPPTPPRTQKAEKSLLDEPDAAQKLADASSVNVQRVDSSAPQCAKQRAPGFSFCIITNGKRPAKLREEIQSIRALKIPQCEILVGGDVPAGFDDVIAVPMAEVAHAGRLGEMRNQLCRRAQYDRLVVADDDMIFHADFYEGLLNFGENYDVLCVRLLNTDGTRFWDWAKAGSAAEQRLLEYTEYDSRVYVTGGLCIMKAAVSDLVQWDGQRGFYQLEDVDFSERLKTAGFSIRCCPFSTVTHNDRRYTQVGRVILARKAEFKFPWEDPELQNAPPNALLAKAVETARVQRYAECADYVRMCLRLDPMHPAARELWSKMLLAFGGDTKQSSLYASPPFEPLVRPVDSPARGSGAGENLTSSAASAMPVLWHGLFYSFSGYAEEARHFVLNLESNNINLAIRSFAPASEGCRAKIDSADRDKLDALLQKNIPSPFAAVVHVSGRCLDRLPGAAYCIGRTMFETDRLPQEWVEKCNRMDEIWVPTEHSLESFRNSGVTARLVKIPGGVDTDRFRPGLNPLPIPGRRKTVFLSIFEWSYRKGWDVLLHSWARAFKPQDDVCLVLRAYPLNASEAPDVSREINLFIDAFLSRILKLNRSQVAPIIVLGCPISEADLPHLYAAATAYVAPSRGEGWGRPQMDAMACGLPVIATGWSGTREFMTERNSILLDYKMADVGPESEIEYFRGHRWAEPSRDHLAQLLPRVVEQPEEMARIGSRARQDMVEKWQWDRVAELAAGRLAEIAEELRGKTSNQLSVVSDQLSESVRPQTPDAPRLSPESVVSDPLSVASCQLPGGSNQLSESALRTPHSAPEGSAIGQELARQGRIPSYKRESVHSMNDAHDSNPKPDLEIGPVSPEANRLLERADAEYRKGNLANARSVLLEALQHLPNSPRIHATLGAILFSLNEFATAREHFAKAAELAPNDPGVRVQLALANLELDQIEDFEAALGRALELDPNYRDALKLLADLNLKQGSYKDAGQTYVKIISRNPEDLDSLLGLGACFFKANEWETAREVYQRILQISPNHSLAANNLAAIKKKIEERASGVVSDQLSVISNQSPGSALRTPHSALNQANVGQASSLPESTISEDSKKGRQEACPTLQPNSEIERLLASAERESQNGNHSSARQILEQALQQAPNNIRVIEQLGMAAFALNDFITAQRHFGRLTEIMPSDPSAFVQLALTHLRLERIDQFEQALGRALDLDPYHRDALKLLADLNLRNDQFKDAAQAYTKILSRHPDDLDALLPLGVCFFKVNDFETAKLVFERVLEKHPGNPVAKENLDVIRQRMAVGQLSVVSDPLSVSGDQSPESAIRNPQSAMENVGQASSLPESTVLEEGKTGRQDACPALQPHSAIDGLLEKAQTEHQRGNLARAKELLVEALRLERDEPRALAAAGAICFALNEFEQAYQYLQRATEVNRRDPAVFVQLALANLKLDQIEEFEVALGRALEIDPHHRDALKLLGDLNVQNGRLKDAAQAYTKILSRHPDDLDALLPLGVCFFKDGDLETARLVFERALERHPDDPVAKENLVAIRQKLSEGRESNQLSVVSDQSSQSAIENVGQASSLPQSTVSDDGKKGRQDACPTPPPQVATDQSALAKLMDQANFFCEVSNRQAALETLEQAVELAPRDPQIRSALGSLHFTQGNYEAAREQFRRLIEIKPRDVDAYTRLAMACLKVNRIEEMEAALGLALEIDPHHREALKFLAKTNLENNRVRDAGRAYAKLLERQPDDLETLLSLGLCFYRGADFESARMVYNRVLEMDPNNVTARENLYQLDQKSENSGQLSVASGQLSVAEAQQSEKSEIAQLNQWLTKADAAVGSQNLAEARDALKAALAFAPDSPEILSAIGTVCFQLGDLRQARIHLERLVQIAPSDPGKWVQLALCHYQLGELAEFESALAKAMELDSNCLDALRLRAQVDFNQGKIQSAAQAFGKMLKQTPNDLEVLMPLAVCFYKTGDYETAKMIFERILELEPEHTLARENLKVLLDNLRVAKGSGQLSVASDQLSEVSGQSDHSALRAPHSAIEKAGTRALDEQLSRANALWSAGDLAGVAAALQEALKASPDSHEICAALGSVLYQKGDLSASCQELQRATQMLPNSSDYQTRLALALLGLERIPEFEAVLGRVLENDPTYRPALRLLADLNFRENRFKDAAQTYHKILLQAPDDTEVMLPLAVCFYKTGDAESAKMVFERVLQIDPQNAVARENLDLLTKPPSSPPPSSSKPARRKKKR
ncbi:MAG: glycosyltransferase [Verrucomicrobia bacterium]|nr:glycosyltransferase [Verrucomicrobiota bacterium]